MTGLTIALQPHISNESFLYNPLIFIRTLSDEGLNGFSVTSSPATAKYKGYFACSGQIQKQEYIFSFRQLLFDQF